jgi:hypothetical protein
MGRHVTVVAYVEGAEDPRYEIVSNIICRTSEQAAEIAHVLREARTGPPPSTPGDKESK